MNDSKLARQIIGELPSLVSQNVIDADTAGALRRHYEAQIKPARSVSIGFVISAILGGLLVGSGIILLLAHNWDDLSKPARAFFSVLPLLAGIALSGYAILRRMDSAAWREGCGVFYFLSIGASIALVSQTYHLYNDTAGFLFYWIALTLPLIYLLNSGAAFAGCLACVVAYSFAVSSYRYAPFSPKPFALLSLALPYYVWHMWKRSGPLGLIWTSWALALALPLMVSVMFKQTDAVYVWAAYGLLGVVYYLAGRRWFGAYRGFSNPYRTLGSLGIVIVSIALTYRETYEHNQWNSATPAALIWLGIIVTSAWLALGINLLRRKMEFNAVAALFPVLIALGIYFHGNGAALLLMNMYALALGVFVLLKGVRRDSLFSMNQGMILITALIVCRFFDSGYGFVARGLAFIFVGCGFLAVNLLAINRRRKLKGGAS